jgi:hypothetical protein
MRRADGEGDDVVGASGAPWWAVPGNFRGIDVLDVDCFASITIGADIGYIGLLFGILFSHWVYQVR